MPLSVVLTKKALLCHKPFLSFSVNKIMTQAKEYKFLPKLTSTNEDLVAEGYKFKNITPRNVVGEIFNAEAILYNEFLRKSVWRSRWFLGMLIPVAGYGIQKLYFKGLKNRKFQMLFFLQEIIVSTIEFLIFILDIKHLLISYAAENLKNSEFVQITEGRFGSKH